MEMNDILYGKIDIPSDISKIINTTLFQRLKHIKQLGLLSCVIPQTVGTRFDHCIGTYYRARQMLEALERNTPCDKGETLLPPVYYQAVVIAALLHDIGHGPFSHTWEYVNKEFHHEKNAIPCVDHIFDELGNNCFEELRDNNNHGIDVIKAIIVGNPKLPAMLVPKQYSFIYEIVNNYKCKLDVDKWDYLKRDYVYLAAECPNLDLDFDDIFLNARICTNGAHIAYNYGDYGKIYKLFEARHKLHLNCYRVPKCLACHYLFKKVVEELDGVTIAEKALIDINAEDKEAFLQFHDDTVWKVAKYSALSKYLEDVSMIEKCDIDKRPMLNNEQISFKEESVIPGPGSEMPDDKKFHFYGDPNCKPKIVRDVKCTKNGGFFFLCDNAYTNQHTTH